MAAELGDTRLNLRTARGLIEDVAERTGGVIERLRAADDEAKSDDFWEGTLKSLMQSWSASADLRKLRADLDAAMDLAQAVSGTAPDVELDDGTTCRTLIAHVHYQRALIDLRVGQSEQAIRHFNESCEVIPTQEAMCLIALCMEIEMRRFEWRGLLLMILTPLYLLRLWFRIYNPFNWRKPRRFWRETFLPFLAGRYSRDEVVAAYRDGIDMDPDTELAVEAGKEIARLK